MLAVPVFLAICLAVYCLWSASTDFGVVGVISHAETPARALRAGAGFFLITGLTKNLLAMMLCLSAGFMWGRA